MLAPLAPTTRRKRFVGELLVVATGAALLVTAYRIDHEWISRHVTQLNLWPEPNAEAWASRGRGLLALFGALVLLGTQYWRVGIPRTLAISRLARLAWPVLLAIAASVLTVEATLRWMESRARPTRLTHELLGTRHPRYGWTWQPSRTAIELVAGRPVHWAFSREGIRVRAPGDEPNLDAPTILFTGESVAAGQGLEYVETYPALISAHLGIQSVNLAANAYGSDQAYLRLLDAMARFPRLVATVTLFLPVQLSRNLQDDKPRLVLDKSGVPELVPAATGFVSRLRIRKLFWNDLPYLGNCAIDRTLALTSVLLRETAARTRARGATPVLVIPSYGPTRTLEEHPEGWIVRALFVQQHLPFVLVDISPDLLLRGDPHPGPEGQRSKGRSLSGQRGTESGKPRAHLWIPGGWRVRCATWRHVDEDDGVILRCQVLLRADERRRGSVR